MPVRFFLHFKSPSTNNECYEGYPDITDETRIHDLGLSGPSLEVSLLESRSILVRTLTGKTLTFQTPERTKVIDLKNMIWAKEGIPENQQRLIFAGHQLENEFFLEDYGIHADNPVHLVLRLRGGMYHPTSGRDDFESLQELSQDNHTVRLLMPGKCEKIVTVNGGENIASFKDTAIALCNEEAALTEADERIKRLRAELADAEEKKERLVRARMNE